MAEEVEISNVGGENGVASEATLASLTRAIEKLAASTGRDPKKEAGKVQKAYNDVVKNGITVSKKYRDALDKKTKATDKATEATNRYSRSMIGVVGGLLGSLTGSIIGLSNALITGGDELTDFAQHIPLIGSLITPFTQMLDRSISTFRDLSSVGAGFNNSITEMRMTAASLELNLDEMAGLVSRNSENLRLLGGTVNEGVSRFTAINRAIKATGNFGFLKNLGFTIEEVNEGIIDFATLQSRMGRLQNMSVNQLAQGSADYLIQLDRLAKVTGRSRQELEAQMLSQAQDAGFRALANQFAEGSIELENFRSSMAIIGSLPADVATGLQDLADGLPQTEEGIMVLTAAGPQIMEAMQQVARGADPQVILDALQAAGHNIENFAGLEGEQRAIYIQALRQSNPVLASILDSATRLMEVGTAEYDAAIAEQARREEITETLTRFDDAVKELRATIATAILESGLFEDLAGAVSSFASLITDPAFKNSFESFINEIVFFIEDIRTFGFREAFANLFSEDGPLYSALVASRDMISSVIGSAFSAIGEGITSWFMDNWDTIIIGALAGIGAIIAAPVIGVFGGIAAGIAAVIGWEKLKDIVEGIWNTITGFFTSLSDWVSNLSLSSILPDWMRRRERTPEEISRAEEGWANTNEFAGIEGFNNGTNGFQDFGSGTLAVLHGKEAVIPLDSPLGQMINNINSSAAIGRSRTAQLPNINPDIQSTTQTTPKVEIENINTLTENLTDIKNQLISAMNTANQGSLESMKQLNTLMRQMLAVIEEMAEDSDQIERNTRSTGSNIANGRVSAVR